jgi:hypothetical protein
MSGSRGEIVTAHGVELIPVTDALVRDPDLRFVATIPVLGIPTRFETNSPTVLRIVDRSFGSWRALGDGQGEADVPARVRIVVGEGDEGSDVRVRHLSTDDGRLIVQSSGSVAISDPARRDATAYVSTALVADVEQFGTELLEAATLALLSALDRHPVHAAAVVKDGRATLFAAGSGTGKSTLAWLCHSAGYALMAEDRVYVQLEPALRVWGWPSSVRLLPEVAARLDASHATPTERRGKTKVEIDAFTEPHRERLVASDVVTCVLTRDGGPAALAPLDPDALARALSAQLAAGFDRFPQRWPAVASALAARGGWRLNLASDPMAALPFVHDILRGGRA